MDGRGEGQVASTTGVYFDGQIMNDGYGEQIEKMIGFGVMARRPDFGVEKIWSREELKEIGANLARMGMNGVREFYERAYRECRMTGRDFPPARAVQELVQAWKQLRRWRAGKRF